MTRYAVEVKTHGGFIPVDDVEWVGNQITYATRSEATDAAVGLYARWTAVTEYRVVKVEEGLNS